jgi:hypothetical protein
MEPVLKDNMKTCPKCNNEHTKSGVYCCRSCANSRVWSEEDKEQKRISMQKYLLTLDVHPLKGKPGRKHSDKEKKNLRKKSLSLWDKIGRKTKEHFSLRNRINVANYRTRKYQATPDDADMQLIEEIYKNCPRGYDVDHIVSITNGGKHHQDNLQYLPLDQNRYVKNNRDTGYDLNLVVRWQDLIND